MKKALLPLLYLFTICAYAQTTGNNFGLGGYQQTIKLSTTKTTDVYTAVEKWFNTNTGIFTVKNAEPTVEPKEKNKNDVDAAYGNSRPLQSLDPNANRLIGQGLIKYFGGTRTSIRLMYVKYDIVVEIKAGQLSFKATNLRYYHFDPKSYTDANVFSFTGGKPCDNTGTMDYLVGCQSNPDEFKALGAFFQQTAGKQFKALKTELTNKKYVSAPAPKKSTTKK
jgi:hypothetical protein